MLLERTPATGVHEFALCLPARAAAEVSNWACGTDLPQGGDDNGETLVRTIEIIRPSEGGPSRHRLAIFAGRDSTSLGEFNEAGEVVSQAAITAADLRGRLDSQLASA